MRPHDPADVLLAVVYVIIVIGPRSAGAVFGGAFQDKHGTGNPFVMGPVYLSATRSRLGSHQRLGAPQPLSRFLVKPRPMQGVGRGDPEPKFSIPAPTACAVLGSALQGEHVVNASSTHAVGAHVAESHGG